MYLYTEYPHPGQVRRARFDEVVRFLLHRATAERVDRYVFPADLSWCVAYTHEDVGGVDLVLAVGAVPFAAVPEGPETEGELKV